MGETAPLIYSDMGYAEICRTGIVDVRGDGGDEKEGKRRSTVALHKKVVEAYFDLIIERRLNTYVTAEQFISANST